MQQLCKLPFGGWFYGELKNTCNTSRIGYFGIHIQLIQQGDQAIMPILEWIGKPDIISYHHVVRPHDLRLVKAKSVGKDSKNMIVHGDSLKVLKSLIPTHKGKIDVAYTDFPYNTGNEEWVYNDNVNSPIIKKWLGKVVADEDLSKSDKWACMVYPRIKLMHQLLSENGIAIFSIDDHEVETLKSILNEIFGKENTLGVMPTITNYKGRNDAKTKFAKTHEYTIVMAKDISNFKINENEVDEEELLKKWNEDEYGLWKRGRGIRAAGLDNALRENSPDLFFPVFVTSDDEVYVTENDKPLNSKDEILWPVADGIEMSWYWSKQKFIDENYNIIVNRGGKEVTLYKKQRPEIYEIPSKRPKTTLYRPEYRSDSGTILLKDIFGKKVFPNPKPLKLIYQLLFHATQKDSVVLDITGGSGVTAHAILQLNKDDGGQRKFMLVEQESYADKITAERVRRVIKGIPNSKKCKEPLGGDFIFYELGEEIDETKMLNGESLPSYDALARYLYYISTGDSIEKIDKNNMPYIASHNKIHYYLYYKPNLKWLESNNGLITKEEVMNLRKKHKTGRIVIFCKGAYMNHKELQTFNVEIGQLPYILNRE